MGLDAGGADTSEDFFFSVYMLEFEIKIFPEKLFTFIFTVSFTNCGQQPTSMHTTFFFLSLFTTLFKCDTLITFYFKRK